MTDKPKVYIEINNYKYILCSKAEYEMIMMSNDTIELIAAFISKLDPGNPTGIELANSIRSLKKEMLPYNEEIK